MTDTRTLDINSLRPADLDPFLENVWLGCIHWALGDKATVEAFREATGNRWQPGTSPLDRAIDEATGADVAFLKAFVAWANENVWGPTGNAE